MSAIDAADNAEKITGNAGTDPSANYVGTSDGQPLIIRTNDTEKMRIATDGKVGIGTDSPEATLHRDGDMILTNTPLLANSTNLVVDENGKIGKGYAAPANFNFYGVY